MRHEPPIHRARRDDNFDKAGGRRWFRCGAGQQRGGEGHRREPCERHAPSSWPTLGPPPVLNGTRDGVTWDRWGRKVHKDRADRDNDDIIWKNGQLFLRAESNDRSDRVDAIACAATDAGGNGVTGTTTVTVPRGR